MIDLYKFLRPTILRVPVNLFQIFELYAYGKTGYGDQMMATKYWIYFWELPRESPKINTLIVPPQPKSATAENAWTQRPLKLPRQGSAPRYVGGEHFVLDYDTLPEDVSLVLSEESSTTTLKNGVRCQRGACQNRDGRGQPL